MGHRLFPGRPELYHGKESSRPYFEGWYFKQVSPDGSDGLALIPGIYRSKIKADDHCFVQVLHDNESRYIRFPAEEFSFSPDEFDIRVGKNRFSMDGCSIDIEKDDFSIKAELSYKSHEKLEKGFLSPSIMGPFSYLPGMQCNHGVLSLHNEVSGWIGINGRRITADGFRGYIEKDWGEAFPTSWLWIQGNSVSDNMPVSCMCSIATIPYGPISFRGLLAIVLAKGRQYRFATYNMSRIKEFRVTGEGAAVVLEKPGHRLEIKAKTNRSSILKAPAATGMDRNILESLDATIEFSLYDKGRLITRENIPGGGLEISETGLVSEK